MYFFVHRDSGESIKDKLKNTINHLILNEGVDTFYIGNNGLFDLYDYKALKELKTAYNNIEFFVVLSHLRQAQDLTKYYRDSETIYPDCFEKTPMRFCIDKRNRWMINNSDYVITHIRHTFGGAYKYASLAKSKGKITFNIV